jgi:hypothetical protein
VGGEVQAYRRSGLKAVPQKSATLSDLKVSEADYEKLYSAAASDFKTKWSSMSAQQQQQSCDQAKKMSSKP